MRAFLREALLGDERLVASRRARFALLSSALSFAAGGAYLALARHETFHTRTFDLAFYARMAWGAAHLDGWNPIVNASAHGLHLVWIDYVLGPLGMLLGTVRVLLVAQALALGLAALPLARIGARHLGPHGALLGAAAFLLHPNLSHAAVGDFHPGAVAVLPLAWLMDALDRRSWQGVLLASLATLLCREDLGLVTALAAGVFGVRARSLPEAARGLARRAAALTCGGSLAYVAFFALVLLPWLGPRAGSLDAHFGHWGASVPAVLAHLATHPLELAAHLGEPARLLYLPTIVAPLAFLPLLAPELVVVALPVLSICLLSRFPTTIFLDSHYLTPALPALVAAALVGAGRVRRGGVAPAAPLLVSAALAQLVGGAGPLSLRFDPRAYAPNADTAALAALVAEVGPDASVQAPDRLLAHFAERLDVRRAPPPEGRTDFVILDAGHRRRFLHDEDALRADEEAVVRDWLSRDDHALVRSGGGHLLFRRGADPRTGAGFARAVREGGDPDAGRPLAACLALTGARLDEGEPAILVLDLVARGLCPSDLALRVGVGWRPRRVDYVAGGLLSPAHLRAGDRIESRHTLTAAERAAIAERGLRVGAIRQSGARPEHGDPVALDVPLAPPDDAAAPDVGAPGASGAGSAATRRTPVRVGLWARLEDRELVVTDGTLEAREAADGSVVAVVDVREGGAERAVWTATEASQRLRRLAADGTLEALWEGPANLSRGLAGSTRTSIELLDLDADGVFELVVSSAHHDDTGGRVRRTVMRRGPGGGPFEAARDLRPPPEAWAFVGARDPIARALTDARGEDTNVLALVSLGVDGVGAGADPDSLSAPTPPRAGALFAAVTSDAADPPRLDLSVVRAWPGPPVVIATVPEVARNELMGETCRNFYPPRTPLLRSDAVPESLDGRFLVLVYGGRVARAARVVEWTGERLVAGEPAGLDSCRTSADAVPFRGDDGTPAFGREPTIFRATWW